MCYPNSPALKEMVAVGPMLPYSILNAIDLNKEQNSTDCPREKRRNEKDRSRLSNDPPMHACGKRNSSTRLRATDGPHPELVRRIQPSNTTICCFAKFSIFQYPHHTAVYTYVFRNVDLGRGGKEERACPDRWRWCLSFCVFLVVSLCVFVGDTYDIDR